MLTCRLDYRLENRLDRPHVVWHSAGGDGGEMGMPFPTKAFHPYTYRTWRCESGSPDWATCRL